MCYCSSMLNETHSIKIGPEFFVKALNDYARPHWALLREFLQNGIDAGSTKIEFITGEWDGAKRLRVVNDGEIMTQEILIDKFLALGGTSKTGSGGTIGGYGRAKEICVLCHKSYSIVTGTMRIDGSGASYTMGSDRLVDGVKTEVELHDSFTTRELLVEAQRLAGFTCWKGALLVNGKHTPTGFKGRLRTQLTFGNVYTSKGEISGIDGQVQHQTNCLVVRVSGVPMFHQYCNYSKGVVIVDITGDTRQVLTASRDSLRYQYSEELNKFLATLATNSKAALENRDEVVIDRYEGQNITVEGQPVRVSLNDILDQDLVPVTPGQVGNAAQPVELAPEDMMAALHHFADMVLSEPIPQPALAVQPATTNHKVSPFNDTFVIRNETGMKLDRSYRPEHFSAFSKRTLRMWRNALVAIHQVANLSDTFAIGFVFSETAAAMHEVKDGQRTYYINPITVGKTKAGGRTMRKRTLDRAAMVVTAAHEVAHGMGNSDHDERFSSALTDLLETVFRNLGKIKV